MFLICSERFSSLLQLPKQEGRISGARASRDDPIISHLLFVDNCILFADAKLHEVQRLKVILGDSGQCVSFEKSFVFFSSNVPSHLCLSLSTELGMRHSRNLEKYLRLPNVIGRSKKASFLSLKVRMQKKVDGWGARFLS